VKDPIATNENNVHGFLQVLLAAKEAKVERFVYASSSSVYGDNQDQVKEESKLGNVLSPYAASKRTDEIYATAFESVYGINTVGLRYFNVFGARQDPKGEYAAVIPRWLEQLPDGKDMHGLW